MSAGRVAATGTRVGRISGRRRDSRHYSHRKDMFMAFSAALRNVAFRQSVFEQASKEKRLHTGSVRRNHRPEPSASLRLETGQQSMTLKTLKLIAAALEIRASQLRRGF